MNNGSVLANPAPAVASMTILVVEKDVWIRVLITDELREQGYTCIEADKADDALDVLRSHIPVDLVLTSLRTPGSIDGGGLAQLIHTEFPSIKILLVSGESPDPTVSAVIDAHVRKPFLLAQLTRVVQTLIPARPLGGSLD